MSQKTYMYDTQWQALINAIDGGDTSAIATALGHIKTSIDAIETALGSFSTGVTQDSTQWTNLINAISSGGGGGGGTIDIDATQWSALVNATADISDGLSQGVSTDLAAINNTLVSGLDDIGIDTAQLTTLINAINSTKMVRNTQDATQWSDLIYAINSLNLRYQSDVILGTNVDGRPTSTGVSLDLFNSAFNTSPQWTVVTNSYIDIYLYKMGILKIIWMDIAKSQIPSGWTPGGLQQLPRGYESLLSSPMSSNNTMRNGTQVTMTVNSTGMFTINPNATIAVNTQVRLSYIYI